MLTLYNHIYEKVVVKTNQQAFSIAENDKIQVNKTIPHKAAEAALCGIALTII